uniref:Fic family protein n=1 Tax=Gluconobacter thailandicus TaxID=257438 RepID=UPI0009EF5EFD
MEGGCYKIRENRRFLHGHHLHRSNRRLSQDLTDPSYIRDHPWGGRIREQPLRRGTAEFVDHGLVSLYLKAWCVLYNDSKISYDQTNSRDYFARLLSDLNGIHPFTDGNGRLVDAVASLGWPTSQSTYAICPVNRSQRYVASWAAGLALQLRFCFNA